MNDLEDRQVCNLNVFTPLINGLIFLPLVSVSTPQFWPVCRWCPRHLFLWSWAESELCPAAALLSVNPGLNKQCGRHQTSTEPKKTQTWEMHSQLSFLKNNCKDKNKPNSTINPMFDPLTSLRVIIFWCWPYRKRISISSDGSRLVLSIIW